MSLRTSQRPLIAALLLLVAWGAAPGTGPWLRSVAASAAQLYRYRNTSRDQRALSLLGEPWALVHRAAIGTPPLARIVIPDGADFDPLSNKTWCAYYLHPRPLLHARELRAPAPGGADYVIAWRGSANGLPGLPSGPVADGVWPLARGSAPAGDAPEAP